MLEEQFFEVTDEDKDSNSNSNSNSSSSSEEEEDANDARSARFNVASAPETPCKVYVVVAFVYRETGVFTGAPCMRRRKDGAGAGAGANANATAAVVRAALKGMNTEELLRGLSGLGDYLELGMDLEALRRRVTDAREEEEDEEEEDEEEEIGSNYNRMRGEGEEVGWGGNPGGSASARVATSLSLQVGRRGRGKPMVGPRGPQGGKTVAQAQANRINQERQIGKKEKRNSL